MIRVFLVSVLFFLQIMTGRGADIAPPHFVDFMRSVAPQDSLKVWPGMFHTYSLQGKYYWEIPVKLQRRDFLLTTTVLKAAARIVRSPEERLGYGNDMMQGAVLRFVRREDQLDIREVFPYRIKDSLVGGIAALYREKSETGRYMSLKILKQDTVAVLADVTELLTGKASVLGLGKHGMDLSAGRFFPEYTYIREVGGPQEDVLLMRSIRTYQPSRKSEQSVPGDFPVPVRTSWEIGTALCLLPEQPLAARVMDGRVEYFTDSFKTNGDNKYGGMNLGIIKRWRLEPRREDMERYMAGELVEPVKPIVFYIDRNTPDFLVPHFIAGVNSWGKAFEKAGFKNAIRACPEPSPEEDPLFSTDNLRYSYISYRISPRQNANGGMITDPRSGEILCGRVSVFHSFLDLVQQWYFNQCAQVDPRIHQAVIPDSLLGQLAEFIIAHEVGHSLGLCHNFIGSSAYSVAQIRDADFVAEHGFGTSVMDYMRFNHLVRPEDKMASRDLIPRVGEYDVFAIEWAYRVYPGKSEKEIHTFLRQWVTEQQKKRELRFGGMSNVEPESQAEDLSDDQIAANVLGIENLKYIAENLKEWQRLEPECEEVWKGRRQWMLFQYNNFIDQVVAFIGGLYREQQGYVQLPRERQVQAIDFLRTQAFFSAGRILENEKERDEFYRKLMYSLIDKCVQLQRNQTSFPVTELTVEDYIRLLHDAVFPDSLMEQELSPEIKSLQRAYVQGVQQLIDRNTLPCVSLLLYGELRQILAEAQRNSVQKRDVLYWNGMMTNIKYWMNH